MPEIEVNGQNINYKLEGEGQAVVLMHGWGQNIQMMDYIFEYLKNSYKVLSFDFPGFGGSESLKSVYGVKEYTDTFKLMLEKLNIENPVLIGHSFGCRVAFRYASENKVLKMILTGAAGVRPKKTFKYKLKVGLYKSLKWILKIFKLKKLGDNLSKDFGSSDYKNTDGYLRQSFVKIVNDDVSDILGKIECPVLLVWGENDDAVPLKIGRFMESKMKNAALVIFENDDHYAYFHQWNRFNLVIDAMLKGDK